MEALTDTTLTRLDVDDLLVQLLGRVREILDVDTAAVLILDADSEMLVARAYGFRSAPVSPDVSPQRRNHCGWITSTRRQARIRSCGKKASK